MEAPIDVELGDWPHPVGAATARIGDVVDAGVAKVGVVAGDVTVNDLAQLGLRPFRRRPRHQVFDDPRRIDPGEVEVGVEVGVDGAVARELPGRVRAEVARPLGAHRHIGVGDRADVVLGERVGVPVAEPLPVVRLDMGDAVGGAGDRRARLRIGNGRNEQRQKRDSDEDQALHGRMDPNRARNRGRRFGYITFSRTLRDRIRRPP